MKAALPALLVALTFLFVLAMALVGVDRTSVLYQPRLLFWVDRPLTQDLPAHGAEDEKPDRPFT